MYKGISYVVIVATRVEFSKPKNELEFCGSSDNLQAYGRRIEHV
jgi:hypothetical protein